MSQSLLQDFAQLEVVLLYDSTTFDYIIIGDGTAGCVLTDRLSADPNITVAVPIEGGPSDDNLPRVLKLSEWMSLLGGPLDYKVRFGFSTGSSGWVVLKLTSGL